MAAHSVAPRMVSVHLKHKPEPTTVMFVTVTKAMDYSKYLDMT